MKLLGQTGWSGSRDKDGHREYRINWLIDTEDVEVGPAGVMFGAPLPAIGAPWAFGKDRDPWAFCWPNWSIQRLNQDKEKSTYWQVEQLFSTKPLKRCQDETIESPLAEPPKISGSFSAVSEEAHIDKDGRPFRNSAFEQIRGKATEFDETRSSVMVEMNIASLPLGIIQNMSQTVNDAPLWGVGPRKIKLAHVTWRRQLYGTCNFYYTVSYEFQLHKNGWDRIVNDEGTMCLLGWSPGSALVDNKLDPDVVVDGIANYLNPKNYEQYLDINGNSTRVFLDGKGRPIQGAADPATITLAKYEESNLLLLGIPTSL